jgi:hypothetical protein
MRGRLSCIVSSTWTDALTLVLETPSVRRLFVVYSPPPPTPPSLGYLAWNLFRINRLAEVNAAKVVIASNLQLTYL